MPITATPANAPAANGAALIATKQPELAVDQVADPEAHGFGRMSLAGLAQGDRGGEEILHLEQAARRLNELVGGRARDRRFVDADGFADHLQIERLEARDAFEQEGILPPHDLAGDVQDGARALLEALGQPVGRLQLGRDVPSC